MTRILKGNANLLKAKRDLRKRMTAPELKLWVRLKEKQLGGLKFRRQHGIGPYVVDFYCAEKQLVLEVDGDTHGEEQQSKYDVKRDRYLSELGVQVMRYTNRDVMENVEGVVEDIRQKVSA